ncbi:MAG: hypothetical protein HZB61_10260 [Nitrospirae bacterium]|nr:hypothetical protein [Nitrospirota bacterium]
MKNENDLIEQLPGLDLPRVARVIGLEATIQLAKAFRGTYLYMHALDDFEREMRDRHIREEYDKEQTPKKVAKLAIKNKLTERQIYNILGKSPALDDLPTLFNLLK